MGGKEKELALGPADHLWIQEEVSVQGDSGGSGISSLDLLLVLCLGESGRAYMQEVNVKIPYFK